MKVTGFSYDLVNNDPSITLITRWSVTPTGGDSFSMFIQDLNTDIEGKTSSQINADAIAKLKDHCDVERSLTVVDADICYQPFIQV